jgi:hypothetical protein
MIVARWREGISPFRYACRIGRVAANSRPHTDVSATTGQKLSTAPIRASTITFSTLIAISADVRRRNSQRICGATMPPMICAPATMAAESPAIWYASGSPYSSSR